MSEYKKNKAVALKYNAQEDTAPVVIASGYGTVAEKIIDIAERKGIPVYKEDSVASMLCMLEVGSDIPVELYEAVAAIYMKLIEVSAKIKGVGNTTDSSDKEAVRTKPTVRARAALARKKSETPKTVEATGHQEVT